MERQESQLFEFRVISCPVCETDDCRLVGYRGGEAHQAGNGVKTSIVRCNHCSHQYPNPMPFPNVELGKLYSEPEEYFVGHDIEQKKRIGLDLMGEFERRVGRKVPSWMLDAEEANYCGRGRKVAGAERVSIHLRSLLSMEGPTLRYKDGLEHLLRLIFLHQVSMR